jgi:hypothetical protein
MFLPMRARRRYNRPFMPIRRFNRAGAFFVALLSLLAASPSTWAKVQLTADVGWSNRFRAGRWTPIYITLIDSAPRQVILEVYSPTDRRYALRAIQSVAIGPTPVTVPIYIPLSYRVDEATITVRDANTSKRLDDFILSDYPSYPGSAMAGPEPVEQGARFVAISGSGGSERAVEGQLAHNTIKSCYIPPPRLPAVAIGYDPLDLLVLSQPDLNKMAADQQRAIADWVRGGGSLVLWPGAEPVPSEGPIADILPATVGANQVISVDLAALQRAGLAPRFAKLRGRALTQPAADAKPIRLFGSRDAAGYRRWIGYGQVVLLGTDLSQLTFNNPEDARNLWRTVLAGVIDLPEVENGQNSNAWVNESRRTIPVQKTMNWIGNIPGAGQFGFSYLAGTLLALMVIVGPVDWFVLKWMGKQPWTWVTITGWIAVVTLGAIYAGHVFKAGDMYYRTASVIDEAAGVRVAATDLVGIYSPQTRGYELTTDPQGWWRPASEGQYYGGGGLATEIACHQDYRGNTPYPMTINVWNLRFLQNHQFAPAAPIVEAKLSIGADGKSITGKITNRGVAPLANLQIRTPRGVARIPDASIAPGDTFDVIAAPLHKDTSLATMSIQEQQQRWQRYDPDDEGPATRPSQPILAGLADDRAAQIDQLLRDRTDIAVVYANYDAEPTDRVKLEQATEAQQSHVGLVRSLVPLE